MRIALVTREATWGGGEVLLTNLAREFTNLGHTVKVMAPRDSQISHRYPHLVSAQLDRPDALLANDFRSLWLNARRAPRARRAFLCHGWWQTSFLRNLACRLLGAQVFAVSGTVATAIKTKGALTQPPIVLPLGPDHSVFFPASASERSEIRHRLGIAADAVVLAWVGRYQDVKRPELFMDSVDALGATGVMVVPDRAESATEDLVRRQLLARAQESAVLVLEGGASKDAYWAADLMISTSEFESLGLAMLEAMACGVPVVTTARGGPTDFVPPSGVVLPTDSTPEDLASAARELLSQDREELAKMACTSVESRSMRTVAETVLTCLE